MKAMLRRIGFLSQPSAATETTVADRSDNVASAAPAVAEVPKAPAFRRESDEDYRALVSRRAYELWVNEGRPQGRQVAHWLDAEQQIRRETDWSRNG